MADAPYYLDPFERIVGCHFGTEDDLATHVSCILSLNAVLRTSVLEYWGETNVDGAFVKFSDYIDAAPPLDPATFHWDQITRSLPRSPFSQFYVYKGGGVGPMLAIPITGTPTFPTGPVAIDPWTVGHTTPDEDFWRPTEGVALPFPPYDRYELSIPANKFTVSGADSGITSPLGTGPSRNFKVATEITWTIKSQLFATGPDRIYYNRIDNGDGTYLYGGVVMGLRADEESDNLSCTVDISGLSLMRKTKTFNAYGAVGVKAQRDEALEILFKREDV